MNELSLFTGAGLGLLGTVHLLGHRPVGYVEIDDYCQRVLRARIDDGLLPIAPIFTDVREFVQSGCARQYRGVAELVTAGFPCQPFSQAGARRGADDPRNQWPATIATIRAVRPRAVLLENVPRLLARSSRGYFGRVLGELAESGYDCRWDCLPASAVGANHQRDRLWIVATRRGLPDAERDALRLERQREGQQRHKSRTAEPRDDGSTGSLADSDCGRCESERQSEHGEQQGACGDQPDGCGAGGWRHGEIPDAQGAGREGEGEGLPAVGDWWQTEPEVGRVVDGMPDRVGQLRALGNGQVPAVVRRAWRTLI